MAIPTIRITCANCKKYKEVGIGQARGICDIRGGGGFSPIYDDKPCNDWLPAKSDVRIMLQRASQSAAPSDSVEGEK